MIGPVRFAAQRATALFFQSVFPNTMSIEGLGEANDLNLDLVQLFADYASCIASAEYNRLRDDIVLFQRAHTEKCDFGPSDEYYEREYSSDEAEEDDDDEDLDETEEADNAEMDEDEDEEEDDDDFVVKEATPPSRPTRRPPASLSLPSNNNN